MTVALKVMRYQRSTSYWVATVPFCLLMVVAGILSVMQTEPALGAMRHLGYPEYLLPLLGAWNLLGVAAVLLIGFPRLKEWAYAGFVFELSSAAYSHAAKGDPWLAVAAPLAMLALALASYLLRPENRRLH
ncbi:MAG: DoxX family protein [Bryobacterales bacterium]|nr:DoxX family protein [Bryobacterales bacterium]